MLPVGETGRESGLVVRARSIMSAVVAGVLAADPRGVLAYLIGIEQLGLDRLRHVS